MMMMDVKMTLFSMSGESFSNNEIGTFTYYIYISLLYAVLTLLLISIIINIASRDDFDV